MLVCRSLLYHVSVCSCVFNHTASVEAIQGSPNIITNDLSSTRVSPCFKIYFLNKVQSCLRTCTWLGVKRCLRGIAA
jgi:hypothetical protein